MTTVRRSFQTSLQVRRLSTVPTRKRTVYLQNLPESHADTKAYASFFLESLHLDRQQRKAIVKFFHPEEASSFLKNIFPTWKRKNPTEAELVEETDEALPATIPAAIQAHGLTRSLRLSFHPSMRLANFRTLLERVGQHEVLNEGKNEDGAKYWVVQFSSVQDALKAYEKYLAEELRGVQNATFVALQHGNGKRATLASLPTSRRIIVEDLPLGVTLPEIHRQLRLPPVVEDLTLDSSTHRLEITFMSSLSVQKFIEANPSRQVMINEVMCSLKTQSLQAPASSLISATRLGASRTLSLSGMHSEIRDTVELEKRLTQMFEPFGPIMDVIAEEGYRNQATVVFSSIDTACRAALQLNRKKRSPRNKFDDIKIRFVQDDINARYDLPPESFLQFLYDDSAPKHSAHVPFSTLASLMNQADLIPTVDSETRARHWE